MRLLPPAPPRAPRLASSRSSTANAVPRRRFLSPILPAAAFAALNGRPALPASPNRRDLLLRLEATMGPLPALSRKAPALRWTGDWEQASGYRRRKLLYCAEDEGTPQARWVPAWLLEPLGDARKRPAVLCLHQTTKIGKDEPAGLGGLPNLHYAHELAQRGFICLVPDYPSFGEYNIDFARDVYDRGYVSGTMFALVNHLRGVDLLRHLPNVEANRLGAIGHSLGGHNTLFLAAFEERLRIAASSCGFTRMARYYGGNLKGWASARYMPRIQNVYRNSPTELPWDFPDILRLIAPRHLRISAPTQDANFDVTGVRECLAAVADAFPKGRLRAHFPDAKHDFPVAERQAILADFTKCLQLGDDL